MTLKFTEFLNRTPSVKIQKFGLGQGLYGGIEPEHKGGGKFLYWRNSRYEKRIGTIKGGMSEKESKKKGCRVSNSCSRRQESNYFQ